MIDVHSHVIWQIDDGSQSLAMSQSMLSLACQQGTEALVLTPHVIEEQYKPAWSLIKERTQQLQEWLEQEGLRLKVYPGAEVQMNWNLLEELAVQGAYCMNGGKYILVELPMEELPVYADNFWYELELKGVHPVLAHPERYLQLMRHKEILYKWRERGLLMQCNAGSFTGFFGPQVQANAKFLLEADMVDLLGSDAHRDHLRTTDMAPAAAQIAAWAGEERLQEITVTNPRLLLANKPLVFRSPRQKVGKNKPSFWQKVLAKLV